MRFSDAAAAGDGLEPFRAPNAANGGPDRVDSAGVNAAAASLAGFGSTVSQEMDQQQHMGSSGRSRKRSLMSDMAAASQQPRQNGSQQQQQPAAVGHNQPPAKHSRLGNGSGGSVDAGGSGRVRAAGALPGIAEETADGAATE